jgi:hypothetical protein
LVRGYGPVAFATIGGFIVGLFFAKSQPTNGLIPIIGFVLLAIGIVAMITNRNPITGTPGGFLTGLGLGITLVQTNIPPL